MEQLTLNLNMKEEEEEKKRRERVKEAESRRKAAVPSEDDWNRIFEMKNNERDTEKLKEVKASMEAGEIARSSEDIFSKSGKLKRFSKAEALRIWQKLQERNRERKLKELVESTPDNYRLVTTVPQLDQLIKDLYNEPIIAVDTETTGLNVYSDRIVGISFTLPNADYHVYIPLAHENCEQLTRDYVLGEIHGILEEECIGKVLHNAKFDMHMFLRHSVRMRGLAWDTQEAMKLLNENEVHDENGKAYSLKRLATKYLKVPSDNFKALFGDASFREVPIDVALVYAAKDTDISWRLYQFQRQHMEKLPKVLNTYEKVENPLIEIVVDMERTGFVIDQEYAKELGEQLQLEIVEIHQKLREHFGDINFNSPQQLMKVLYDDLKLGKHLPARKKKSTDAATLETLRKHHEGVDLLLDYREKTKLRGTYVETLPRKVHKDGRLHGEFNQNGAATGRFSSSKPNFQNQPYYARKLFVAPKGKVLLSGDFSQQEPRLLAHFSNEDILINAYREGRDLYSTAASETFGLPLSECGDGSKWRKMMKTGILAVMYGTSPKTLAEQLGITEKEAKDFIETFYKKHPKVKRWIDGNIRFARRNRYVEMLGGRKRRLPEINSRDRWMRLRAERQCTNAIIQGSAAIQTKLTMIELDKLCKRKGWQMALTVHDEIGVYAPDSISLADVKEFESVFLDTVKLRVPNKTDIEISRRWGEGKTIKEWFGVKESEAIYAYGS
ncbi:DNA polymerase [Mechercharimyces sp. CAU 1602]|uniref:DNA polymerase n=1 Tax=Mechercharimyces sp. CAU 1602 TaxID=2973933 RepID=UPI0021622B72|nr:DNA polymerase [Mechercharimyces sp. CAU 1602]MCS1350357.1 DNA polymerase [Mechercharimyces sp. CAU 1602]